MYIYIHASPQVQNRTFPQGHQRLQDQLRMVWHEKKRCFKAFSALETHNLGWMSRFQKKNWMEISLQVNFGSYQEVFFLVWQPWLITFHTTSPSFTIIHAQCKLHSLTFTEHSQFVGGDLTFMICAHITKVKFKLKQNCRIYLEANILISDWCEKQGVPGVMW